ncbi:MAG: hypothetical protein GY868_17960 [Deltaproteobacteria bacterium]|nr:hypothetical protein [Deltaproteobacteria bacterium]
MKKCIVYLCCAVSILFVFCFLFVPGAFARTCGDTCAEECVFGASNLNSNTDCGSYCRKITDCCEATCIEDCLASGGQEAVCEATCTDRDGQCRQDEERCEDECDALEDDANDGVQEAIDYYELTCLIGCYCDNACSVLVEMDAITVTPGNKEVVLTWTTAAEISNQGFNVLRSENGEEYRQVNADLIVAQGSPTAGETYTYTDLGLENRKTYSYLIEDVDLDGLSTTHGPKESTPRFVYGIISLLFGNK